jgi:hypothetical protein
MIVAYRKHDNDEVSGIECHIVQVHTSGTRKCEQDVQELKKNICLICSDAISSFKGKVLRGILSTVQLHAVEL